MLEYIQTSTLLALLVFFIYLEKTMRSKIEEMPSPTGDIENKITGMTEVLDDIADLLNDGLNMVTAKTNPNPQAGMDIPTLLTNLFMSKVNMPQEHGRTQEPQEREIHDIDPTPQEQTEIVNQ